MATSIEAVKYRVGWPYPVWNGTEYISRPQSEGPLLALLKPHRRRIVTVIAPPGYGKTSFLRHIQGVAGSDYGGRFFYLRLPSQVQSITDYWKILISTIVPDNAEQDRVRRIIEALPATGSVEDDETSEQTAADLLIAELGSQQPIVVLIDDFDQFLLHCRDDASRIVRLNQALIDRDTSPFTFVVAQVFDPEWLATSFDIHPLNIQARNRRNIITLVPFSLGDMDRLVGTVLHYPLPRDTKRILLEESAGNPFYLKAMLFHIEAILEAIRRLGPDDKPQKAIESTVMNDGTLSTFFRHVYVDYLWAPAGLKPPAGSRDRELLWVLALALQPQIPHDSIPAVYEDYLPRLFNLGMVIQHPTSGAPASWEVPPLFRQWLRDNKDALIGPAPFSISRAVDHINQRSEHPDTIEISQVSYRIIPL